MHEAPHVCTKEVRQWRDACVARTFVARPSNGGRRTNHTSVQMLAISSWSSRRVATIWVAGLSIQAALLILPAAWALSNAPGMRARWDALSTRWSIAERSDSIAIAAQRAGGATRLGPSGDSVYAVVQMPSGRPNPRAERASRSMWIRAVAAIYSWGIPLSLVWLTLVWRRRRRDRDNEGGGIRKKAMSRPV